MNFLVLFTGKVLCVRERKSRGFNEIHAKTFASTCVHDEQEGENA